MPKYRQFSPKQSHWILTSPQQATQETLPRCAGGHTAAEKPSDAVSWQAGAGSGGEPPRAACAASVVL